MTTAADWYYQSGNEPVGPLDFSALSDLSIQRQLARTSLVWRSGTDDWVTVESIDALATFLPKSDTKLNMRSNETLPTAPTEAPAPQSLTVQEMLQHAHGVQPSNNKHSVASSERELPKNTTIGFYHRRSFAGKWTIWFTVITLVGTLIANFIDLNALFPSKPDLAHPSLIWWVMFSYLNWIGSFFYSLYCLFKNGWGWGLACLFIPFAALIYVVKFWEDWWRSLVISWFFAINFAAPLLLVMDPQDLDALINQIQYAR